MNIIFLSPFSMKDASLDDKTSFLIGECFNVAEYEGMGKIYTYQQLTRSDIRSFIRHEIRSLHPNWVIAENESATAVLGLKCQKKILINPTVQFNNLNNIPEFAREFTYAFFDRTHERDYNRFQTVYPNSFYYPTITGLSLFMLKVIVEEIITRK